MSMPAEQRVATGLQPKRNVVTLGVDAEGRYRGIFKDERIHMAVFGFPGTGKSRFLLSLALQNVRDGDGVMIVDPHGDLAKIFLSHVPRERWEDVIYIDPTTSRRYGRVVKINFLECPDVRDRDVVARAFMDSLEKIYSRFWGPRLDMIMMNAIYLILDAMGEEANISMLYNVVADEQFRETLLEKVMDERIRSFWESEFKKMSREASSAVLTKLYRIVQERILAPMFDCKRSRIDFRKVMDERKIVVVNLSEGAITSDAANFLGSLILSRVYLAGMSREDTPEEERVPFYVYVDEAYRFVSLSIRDILQSLRKYKVFMTLASQYLDQYSEEIAKSIPHLCDTIVCFSVGEETARELEEFFRPSLSYMDLVHLPRHVFAVSTIVGGVRERAVLKSIDCGWGPNDVEELIKLSLKIYGDEVDMARYFGAPALGGLPHPTTYGFVTPLPWIILVKLYELYEESLRAHCSQYVSHEDLVAWLRQEFEVSETEIERALNELSFKNLVKTRTHSYDFEAAFIPTEPPLSPTPMDCSGCGQPTLRAYKVRGGRLYCRPCLGRAILRGEILASDVVDPPIDPGSIRIDKVVRYRATKRFYAIAHHAKALFFEQIPKGGRGGGVDHAKAIGAIARMLLKDYCWIKVDTGEETPRKAADGTEDYEVKGLPDVVVCPVARAENKKLNPRHWDTGKMFAVEVEMDPIKHRKRVLNNLTRDRKLGIPVVFATTDPKWAEDLIRIMEESGERVVHDNTGLFGGIRDPRSVSVLFIDPETEARTFITPGVRISQMLGELARPEESGAGEGAQPILELRLENLSQLASMLGGELKLEGGALEGELTVMGRPVKVRITSLPREQPKLVEEPAKQPATSDEEVDKELWKSLTPEDKLRTAVKLGYTPYLRAREKWVEVYVQKKVAGRLDRLYVGLLTDELRRVAEELGVKL